MAQWDGPGRLRASDAEREQVATILRAAVTEGRLNLEEGDERLAKAYAATYRDDLRPLTEDLPDGGTQALRDTPEAVAAIRRRLRRHGAFVFVVAGLLVGAWVLSGAHFFWPLLPLLFLGFGLLRHWRFSRWWRYGGGPGPGYGHGRGWNPQPWDAGQWRGGQPRGRGEW
jgi:Domain of unknown function (DUF1707)